MLDPAKAYQTNTVKWIKEKFKSEHPLSRNEEKILIDLAKNGNQKAKERLLKANMKFVIQVASKYSNNTLAPEELINEGAIGLWHAIRDYDNTRGVRFITYAVWWIKAHITRAISEKGNIIRLPVNQQLALKKAKKSCTEENDLDDSMKVLSSICGKTYSLDRGINVDCEQSLKDYIQDEKTPAPDALIEQELRTRFIKKVLRKLPQKERLVIEDINGFDKDSIHSIREEARILKISRERVRQLRDQAIKRLNNLNYDGHLTAELL